MNASAFSLLRHRGGRTLRLLVAFALTAAFSVTVSNPVGAASTVVFVDVDATGVADGSSWADAFQTLPDALDAAPVDSEVWVAEGVYSPASQGLALSLLPGVSIYGGFAGTETTREQADPDSHPTVVTGDLAGDDAGPVAAGEPSRSENAFSLFVAAIPLDPVSGVHPTVLDGMTLRSGNANGLASDASGPAISFPGGPDRPLTLSRLVIEDHSSLQDGAVSAFQTDVRIVDSIIRDNVAAAGRGGGVYVNGGSVEVLRTSFVGNVNAGFGGEGGGLSSYRADTTIVSVVFDDNRSGFAGALNIESGFTETPVAKVHNSLFTGNVSTSGSGNVVVLSGAGGPYSIDAEIASSTFTDNGEPGQSSAISDILIFIGHVDIDNTIVWGNESARALNLGSAGTATWRSSNVEGSGAPAGWDTSLGLDGGDNLDGNPAFTGSFSGDFTPTATGLGSGNPSLLPHDLLDTDGDSDLSEPLALDILGRPRMGANLDMGAFQTPGASCDGLPATLIAEPGVPLVGTAGADVIVGTPQADVIDGGGGNDTICGFGGNDVIDGGDGDDDLFGGTGADYLFGGLGADFFDGGEGDDVLQGGIEVDEMYGGGGDDALIGAGADDLLYGGDGNDWIQGDGGADLISGDPGDDVLLAGDGDDRGFGGSGRDYLAGGTGADDLAGDEGDDWLEGGSGADDLDGGVGNDILAGENFDESDGNLDGADLLLGGDGFDYLAGGPGDDRLFGGNNDPSVDPLGLDWLEGGEGDDELRGGPDNDYLLGGSGADALFGDGGADYLQGDAGINTYEGGSGNDVMWGGPEGETFRGGDGDDLLYANQGDDDLFGDAGSDYLDGGYNDPGDPPDFDECDGGASIDSFNACEVETS